MVCNKLPMELIPDQRTRYRTFRNRESGLKKKISELCTLCGIKACMVIYGPDGDGPCSSQPRFWPENRREVECIINEYMEKRKKGPEKRALNLADVLEIGKGRADHKPPLLQENFSRNKQQTLLGGVDEFTYEELIEIIGKLDKKLEEVEILIELKKGETDSVNEPTMQSSSTIQPLHSDIQSEDNLDFMRDLMDGMDSMNEPTVQCSSTPQPLPLHSHVQSVDSYQGEYDLHFMNLMDGMDPMNERPDSLMNEPTLQCSSTFQPLHSHIQSVDSYQGEDDQDFMTDLMVLMEADIIGGLF